LGYRNQHWHLRRATQSGRLGNNVLWNAEENKSDGCTAENSGLKFKAADATAVPEAAASTEVFGSQQEHRRNSMAELRRLSLGQY
jgi:hypothetical protein